MSDDWIRVVSSDPTFVPSKAIEAAVLRELAEMIPAADEITGEVSDHIAFVDAGVNLEQIRCRGCGAELDEPWWSRAVSESHERSGFRDRRVSLPCCGAVADLNELDYGDWPVAFARWWVDCMNPDVGRLSEAQMERLSVALGHKVTIVYQHL